MSKEGEKTIPSLPADYVVPKVWNPPQDAEGAMSRMNLPTAGARHEKELPKGEHPIQLYSMGTPNGQKVAILCEELGIDYDAWKINIFQLDQFGSDFVNINPNSKIPAMLDYSQNPPLRIFESGSILLFLADKHKKFIPQDIAGRTECINWLMWQMGTAPYIGGGFGHFYRYAPIKIEYAIDRFTMECKRIMDVLDKHLEGKEFVCGQDYTIADIAIFPWMRPLFSLPGIGYDSAEFLSADEYKNIQRWMNTLLERDGVKRGMRVNGFGPNAIKERHSPDDFN